MCRNVQACESPTTSSSVTTSHRSSRPADTARSLAFWTRAITMSRCSTSWLKSRLVQDRHGRAEALDLWRPAEGSSVHAQKRAQVAFPCDAVSVDEQSSARSPASGLPAAAERAPVPFWRHRRSRHVCSRVDLVLRNAICCSLPTSLAAVSLATGTHLVLDRARTGPPASSPRTASTPTTAACSVTITPI